MWRKTAVETLTTTTTYILGIIVSSSQTFADRTSSPIGNTMDQQPDDPLPSPTSFPDPSSSTNLPTPAHKSTQWLTWALGSGAFAAFNGVFAKLTTTSQTNTLSSALSTLLGLSANNNIVSFAVRGLFFAMNLLCNAIMWILFTRALTLANSTTQVAILNTSANFMVTALLGMLVFSEGLPLLWWVGAAFLVAGSVIIGLREQKNQADAAGTGSLREDNGQEDAGSNAAVALGTGGMGAGAAIVDSVEHNRYRDSVEGSTGDVELEEEQEGRR
jgi:drug/metabolite transporter (DMT)-like permease